MSHSSSLLQIFCIQDLFSFFTVWTVCGGQFLLDYQNFKAKCVCFLFHFKEMQNVQHFKPIVFHGAE